MNADDLSLIERLWDLGFSPFTTKEEAASETTPEILSDMIDLYCQHHHISREQFPAHVALVRMCKLPDKMTLGVQICKFATTSVRWCLVQQIPGLSPQDVQAVFTKAWQQWADVSGLRPTQVADATLANVLTGSRAIDGPSKVLAESELPCGVAKVSQWFDSAERWSNGPGPSNTINLVAVACHEIGHALGLEHTNDGGLMDPFYNAAVTKPRGGQELAAIQLRYGKPSPSPDPTPTPGGLPDPLTITLSGGNITIPGYRVQKL